jgi:hypothetical protein
MKIRIIQKPSRYGVDESMWDVQTRRWYWPFWITVEPCLSKVSATGYAQMLVNPTIVNVQ